MEINPYESRMRILQDMEGVQMQREAAPDSELAGCPGCPYYWTCPVPHRGETVSAPAEIDLADVAEQVGPRAEFTPRGVEDIGWTDQWIDVEDGVGAAAGAHAAEDGARARARAGDVGGETADPAGIAAAGDTGADPVAEVPRRRRGLFRRR